MKIIAIGVYKGGTAKTMSTYVLSGILAERGYKVLCMDCDPQGDLTTDMGVDRTASGLKGMEVLFDNDNEDVCLDDIVVKAPIPELPTWDIIPSTPALFQANERLPFSVNREVRITYFIEDHEDEFEKYDYILIDTTPTDGPMNHNAYAAADSIIMPLAPDRKDIHGAISFEAEWNVVRKSLRIKNNIECMFPVMLDYRCNFDKSFRDELVAIYGEDNVLKNCVPLNNALKNSTLEYKPINIVDKTCKGYLAYNGIVDELFEKGVF